MSLKKISNKTSHTTGCSLDVNTPERCGMMCNTGSPSSTRHLRDTHIRTNPAGSARPLESRATGGARPERVGSRVNRTLTVPISAGLQGLNSCCPLFRQAAKQPTRLLFWTRARGDISSSCVETGLLCRRSKASLRGKGALTVETL